MKALTAIALASLGPLALMIGGCADLKGATTPASLNDDADLAYIAVATGFPSNAQRAWTALQAERAAYVALTHVATPTPLDLQADALKPAAASMPVFLLASGTPLTQTRALAQIRALEH
jgi:hypothetical protein